MTETKKYWKGLEELKQEPEFEKRKNQEFPEHLPFDEGILKENGIAADRRDFLKMFGFGIAAVSLASCEIPVKKAIPYLNKPEEITPGVANWYASTYSQGGDYCSILVKTREGRPIKIEGNDLSPLTKGGVQSKTHASVLELYDVGRLTGPQKDGADTDWDTVDSELRAELTKIKGIGGEVVILSSTIISPSTKAVIDNFLNVHDNARHITYDAVSYYGMLKANQNCFDKAVIPNYHFEKANVILSIGADFLGTWLSTVQYTKQYVENRKPEKKKMSRLISFESNLSLTGANADLRTPIKPSQVGVAVLNLYNHIAKWADAETYQVDAFEMAGNVIQNTAKELWANRRKSLVVCGSNDPAVQSTINAINSLLGNYGSTIDLSNPSHQRQGNDEEVDQLIADMNSGQVGALIMYGVNPAYDHPKAKEFISGLQKVGLSVSFSGKADETASLCNYICPDHHYLESWNDAEPVKGYIGICQPVIRPLHKTRSAQESLMKWSGASGSYDNFIKKYWRENYYSQQTKYAAFRTFWNNAVHDGVCELPHEASSSIKYAGDLASASSSINSNYSVSSNKTELALYQKVSIGDGSSANSPWLQELPDPITKVTWDNYVTISPKYAKEEFGIEKSGGIVNVKSGNESIELPLILQPGQAYQTVGIAVGYGRSKAGKTADGVGKNAYGLSSIKDGIRHLSGEVTITPTEEVYPLAQTQTHETLAGRPIIKETTLDKYNKNSFAGNEDRAHIQKNLKTIYEKFDPKGHHWAMVIDLNACTGCGSCVVSCSAENNVPVVGKTEVANRREMHWLRIDRYYSTSDPDSITPTADAENPDVVFQPMLCQHCDNAPCENVCPVAATNHSSEGINQMAYNRCIGTRYCANNCPYKVRRFNWLDYADNDSFPLNSQEIWQGKESWGMMASLPRMALNPDVVVRTRGVMEKCSFCIQRIQGGKLEAKKAARNVRDGEVKTACQQSCPANAIKFGDLLDKNSEVSKLYKNERMYHVLEELHVLPSVGYLTKVRNRSKKDNNKA